MTKKQYIELTGEDPVDMFGSDYENTFEEYELKPIFLNSQKQFINIRVKKANREYKN